MRVFYIPSREYPFAYLQKPVSHVKEIPAFLAIMHLVELGGAWLCRL